MRRTVFSSCVALRKAAGLIALAVVVVAIAGLTSSSAFAQVDGFLTYGASVSGEVRTLAGEEWFFTGCAADLVTIEMVSDEFDSYVELYGPASRRTLIEDNDSGDNDNALLEDFELPESGVYTIVAAGAARRDRGEYTLSLDSDRDAGIDEVPTLAYGETVSGTVSTIRGEEWTFWGCADDGVTLVMDSTELSGYLELYGPVGRLPLMETDVVDQGSAATISDFSLPESGIYTVVAAGQSRRDRGEYSLSLLTSASNDSVDSDMDSSTPAPQSTETLTPTVSAPLLMPTTTPISAPTFTPTPLATATPTLPSVPGLITDFEAWGIWRRGDETWGTFTQSGLLAHGGQYAGKFDYDFPADEPRNYLIYLKPIPSSISGKPTALTIWVYGDGSGNFLNAWVLDADDQLWQFTFGRIYHAGWRQMVAPLDLELGWPNQAIDNPSADAVAYPIQFAGLVLDGADEDKAYKGVILVDDLIATTDAGAPSEAGVVDETPTPQETPEPTATAVSDPLPAPIAIGYHFPAFKWAWQGMPSMQSVDNWYFDLKIFNNEHSEYPYDILVVEADSVDADGPNLWRLDRQYEFRCGSHWAVQIAGRNADGSYAGPLSPESNRVPSGRGCEQADAPHE